jgi:23S rRNA pseudouridine1911/1915/1917 synthase
LTEQQNKFIFQDHTHQRLDKFLVRCLPDYSRTRLQNLIKSGNVTIDDDVAQKSGQLLEHGARVAIILPPPEPSSLVPEPIPLDIIFENTDLLVINKPAGMVVHPSAGHSTGTLVHAALAHAPEMEGVGGVQRPGVVHRLDKDTSGLILLAKNDRTHYWLQDQFKDRQVEKVYLALVDGNPPTPEGRVDAAIGRDTTQRKRMTTTQPHKGRQSTSDYRTLERFPKHTLLEVHPITGRTHQIRVHLAFLGCPVVGDQIYGKRKSSLPLDRHFLHAHKLSIVIPGEATPRTFEAPLPDELESILEILHR